VAPGNRIWTVSWTFLKNGKGRDMRIGLPLVQFILFSGFLSAALAAGCAAPVVTVRHKLPAAVVIPGHDAGMRVKGFSVKTGPKDGFADFAAGRLRQRLAKSAGRSGAANRGALLRGDIHIAMHDTKGTRRVRRGGGKTGDLASHEVSALIRTGQVRVDFVVTRAPDGEELVTIETRRSYRSTGDPRVRGELGLLRPDDPTHVPAAETIVRELLTEYIASFCAMIAPLEVVEQVPLRNTLAGGAGFRAVRAGDLEEAARHFEGAVADAPRDVALLFNLAVTAEGAGKLQAALDNYRAVQKLANGQDPPAAAGTQRIERIIHRLGKSKK